MTPGYRRVAGWLFVVVVAGSWLGPASSVFGFIWAEPLPQLPPNPQSPPPALLSLPPDKLEDPPPNDGAPPLDSPEFLPGNISNTPEPTTLVAGLVGAGALALWHTRRKNKRAKS